MYSILGWLNVVILGVLVTPYVLNFANRKFLKFKNKSLKNIVKVFRKFHKPLGLTLAVVAIVHGYLALGSLRIHTGSLLYLSVIITAAFGGSFYKLKKRVLFKMHKIFAGISILLLLLHLFYPSAIYYLLN
jgi:hypothetical protein